MTRLRLSVLAAALGAMLAPLAAASKPSNTPANVALADTVGSTTSRIRSDGGGVDGSYLDGEDCVQSWYALPKGNFFLRTVTSQPPCGDTVSVRRIVIDLTDRVWPSTCPGPQYVADRYGNTLDVCGSNNVPDVRLVADRLFSANATALDVPFSLQPDFRYTAFELDFVETLSVTGAGATRTMTAGANAISELWQISGRTKALVGRYRVPLSATVTTQ
jgi:hypothetical protein